MRFIEGISDEVNYESINYMYNLVNLIHKARIIARAIGINIILPVIKSISKNDIDHIELVHDLITKGEYRRDRSSARFKAQISPNEIFFEKFGKEDTEKNLSTPLSVEVPDQKLNVFGTEINLGPLRFILTNPKIIVHKSINGKNMINNRRDLILAGTKKSELIVTKI
jgi:hypothetical protein